MNVLRAAAGLFLVVLTYGRAGELVSLVTPASSPMILDGKTIGQVQLPVGSVYELIGVMDNKFLLQSKDSRYLVSPEATDYWEKDLLAQLDFHSTPAASAPESSDSLAPPYVADVTIFPTGVPVQAPVPLQPASPATSGEVANDAPSPLQAYTYIPNVGLDDDSGNTGIYNLYPVQGAYGQFSSPWQGRYRQRQLILNPTISGPASRPLHYAPAPR